MHLAILQQSKTALVWLSMHMIDQDISQLVRHAYKQGGFTM